eukprot:5436226-Prymnesium_polylepis.1
MPKGATHEPTPSSNAAAPTSASSGRAPPVRAPPSKKGSASRLPCVSSPRMPLATAVHTGGSGQRRSKSGRARARTHKTRACTTREGGSNRSARRTAAGEAALQCGVACDAPRRRAQLARDALRHPLRAEVGGDRVEAG